jgi:nucleoside-diphosphate-sugar epimerase
VFGFSPRLRFDLVVNNLAAWALSTGRLHLKSTGNAWRPIIHIEDIARAFLSVIEAPRTVVHNQVFNVAPRGENYRIIDLARLVRDTIPGSRLEYADGAEPDKRSYRVDGSKLLRTLQSFQTNWTARKGIEELHDAFVGTGLKQSDFEGIRFKRIAHIRHLISQNLLGRDLRWTEGERRAA